MNYISNFELHTTNKCPGAINARKLRYFLSYIALDAQASIRLQAGKALTLDGRNWSLLTRSVPDCLFRFHSLPADVVGNVREVAFVGTNCCEIVGLAD